MARKRRTDRWQIPPYWLDRLTANGTPCRLTSDSTILEAVECALAFTILEQAYLQHARIPLITHQTWRSLNTESWSDAIRAGVERWLEFAKGEADIDGPEMAWFLWDDDGIDMLTKSFAADIYEDVQRLPYPVEKADVFRVLVVKWFGGIYADVDATPLKHPFGWVLDSDITPWTDASSSTEMTLHMPSSHETALPGNATSTYEALLASADLPSRSKPSVHAIFGIEADNPPEPDPTYWRMGYSHPVQVTNWALAMAPHHAVADQFLNTLIEDIRQNSGNLLAIDPLDITGPPALTRAIQAVAHRENPSLSWDSLSANGDPIGGRGKIVAGDALVLPITGFNPGRGWFQNMGSKSIEHPNARLWHAAAGSWRKMDLKVQVGKLCRSTLGFCRGWRKIPG
ncbi:uncharacterized protein LTR77_007845 [Saxophila tyrrhenica]|uniref:Uncharacterized protein n=1 Tax=Saxophila tyrrhenica TaxID=1690608 RepID=A0AAV9P3R0_9PEZI|nr:hypothetical protein LTR77_007845 [Saxophila tyrrhenica]